MHTCRSTWVCERVYGDAHAGTRAHECLRTFHDKKVRCYRRHEPPSSAQRRTRARGQTGSEEWEQSESHPPTHRTSPDQCIHPSVDPVTGGLPGALGKDVEDSGTESRVTPRASRFLTDCEVDTRPDRNAFEEVPSTSGPTHLVSRP